MVFEISHILLLIVLQWYYFNSYVGPFLQSQLQFQPSIFFGIISTYKSTRQNHIYSWWIKNLPLQHNYAFLTQPSNPKYNYLVAYPQFSALADTPSQWLRPHKDRAIKRITGMKYFYENTSHEYYWSLTDDIAIDIDNLDNNVCL